MWLEHEHGQAVEMVGWRKKSPMLSAVLLGVRLSLEISVCDFWLCSASKVRTENGSFARRSLRSPWPLCKTMGRVAGKVGKSRAEPLKGSFGRSSKEVPSVSNHSLHVLGPKCRDHARLARLRWLGPNDIDSNPFKMQIRGVAIDP